MTDKFDEYELLKKAKAGDADSFEALIMSCKTKAWNIALRFMRNENDAMDALQESFIKIYTKLNTFRGESGFNTWAYRITVNTCKDILKKNKKYKRQESLYTTGEDGEFLRDFISDDPTPEEETFQKETARELSDCINMLSQEQQEMIILRDVHGFSYADIGDMLSIPAGTVKSRISRARNTLKELWMEQKQIENV
ncbi:MAG: sigma-70 family RNA polymerase sigma factor [Clostridiales Family XIII bacterium]|jgi:RNA polymerase sigma-70 factor (ECF subfamily)|nr:sigma-70 family RNA polymerase sigma factor [Clostridiales Family XIII bacterium]